MKKRSGLFRINIVLGVIFILLIVVDLIVVAAIGVSQDLPKVLGDNSNEEYSSMEEGYWEWFEDWEEEHRTYIGPHLLFTDTWSVQLIGDEYGDEPAWEDYQYYLVTVYVKNVGNSQQTVEYAPIYCEGASNGDVYNIYQWDNSESDFSYVDKEMIPVGQTCPVEIIVRVRDGVREFNLIIDQTHTSQDWYEQITIQME